MESIMNKLTLLCLFLYFNAFLYGEFTLQKHQEFVFIQEIVFFAGEGKLGVIEKAKNGYDVHIYKKNVKKKFFIRKGEGPSELLLPGGGVFKNKLIYIHDRIRNSFLIFGENGKFHKTFRLSWLYSRKAFLLGMFERKPILLCLLFRQGKKRKKEVFTQDVIIWKNKTIVNGEAAKWQVGGKINFDRDFLLASFDRGNLAITHNRKYKVEIGRLSGQNFVPITVIEKNKPKIPWRREEFRKLEAEILPKELEAKYPEYLPPIFAIALSGNYLAVASNEKAVERTSVIDIWNWQEKKYLGKVNIPLIYAQHSLHPFPFFRFSGFELDDHFLYTLHYKKVTDEWVIIKWKIIEKN